MSSDNPFANYFEDEEESNDDRTVISSDLKPSFKPQGFVALPVNDDVNFVTNPITRYAWTLLSLVAYLRNSPTHSDVASLRTAVIQEIKQFDSHLQKQGIAIEQQQAARYVLCALLDETVLNTAWGCNSVWSTQSLLITFHKEAWGGEKFFLILKHCLQQVNSQLPLLELLYFCLCLGFEGKYRIENNGISKLQEVRDNVFRVLQQQKNEAEKDLSVRWRALQHPQHPLKMGLPFWQIALASAVLLLVVFLGFYWLIHSEAEPLVARLNGIKKGLVAPPAQVITPVADDNFKKLQGFLAPEIQQKLVTLEQNNGKTILRIVSKNFFASGSDQVMAQYQPLLSKITLALADVSTNIVVVGHTDNTPIYSKRFPSNWELSKARAGTVALALMNNATLAGKVSYEGKADTQPLVPNDTAEHRAMNRRVEIIF